MSDKVISETPTDIKAEVIAEVEVKSPGEIKEVEISPEESRRREVDAKIKVDRETYPEPEVESKPGVKVEDKVEVAEKPEESPTAISKAKIQKRIDKEVGKRKTAEEELAQVRSELDILKAQIKPEPKTEADVNREPTDSEIRTALLQAKRDGNIEFEVQILEYMAERKAKAQRAEAEKSYQDANTRQSEATKQFQKDWQAIQLDYQSSDPEMNLSNPKGMLYRVAKELYEDKDLSQSVYSDPNRAFAMRRAVSDAYREIMENNLLPQKKQKEVVSEEIISPKAETRKRSQLADPSSTVAEESTSTSPTNLSDTEKVLNDVKRRRQMQEQRIRS